MLIFAERQSFLMHPMSEAISGWANTHKKSLLSARAAVLTGNYSMAIEILDMTVEIMDKMVRGLEKI